MEKFKQLLTGFDLIDIENHEGTVFGLRDNYTIAYFNKAWKSFAQNNDGEPAISSNWGIGAQFFNAVPEIMKSFYLELFRRCRAQEKSVKHTYECSSPDVYRKFQQIIYPLNTEGYLIVNSLLMEEPHRADLFPYAAFHSTKTKDIIYQCANCRKVRHQKLDNRWDFIPQWIHKAPAMVSHTLCSACEGFYKHIDGL